MKKILHPTLFGISLFFVLPIHAQVILNEVYSEPGAGKQEFFELYNINTSNTPSSLDAYTVISYFEEGSKKGFYVLDLPNLFVASKGYFVGASSIPFNYQGTSNSTAANFSWNDPTLPLNYGYMRKWVSNGGTALDGNKNYDLETLPSDFNDFFSRRSGSGATYNAFVYKNGNLVNSFFGGTGGNATMPAFITSMPMFKLEVVTAANTQTHVLNFGSLKNKPIESIEYVTQDIGSDNGYIKTKDGFCGTWTKSSSQTFHTPGTTNGYNDNGASATLTLDTHVYEGPTASDPSFVVYNITSGTSTNFPVELQVYLDNGTVAGQLDTQDEFVEINIEHSVNEGPFTTYLPANRDVLIIAKTDAGCIDQIVFAHNPLTGAITLPVKFITLQGSVTDNEAVISWSVAENESGNYFQVEKSLDGKNFVAAGVTFNTTKTGNESYSYKEAKNNYSYYRLKVFNKDQSIGYSKIILIKNDADKTSQSLRLIQNPVQSSLNFSYQSSNNDMGVISIYTISGTRLSTTKSLIHQGGNSFSIELNNKLANGMYILEITSGNQRSTTKFLKQ
jgi:hypothetical protein